MLDLQPALHPGLVLMGGMFVWAGVHHFRNFKVLTGWLVSKRWPFPRTLLTLGSILQIVAGALLMAGVLIPVATVSLIVFTVVANVTLLDFWRQPSDTRDTARNAFAGNIALIGGLMLAFSMG